MYTVGTSYLQVSASAWKPENREHQLYSLYFAILYKGLEHLRILLFPEGSRNQSLADTKE